ncbi:MAG: glycoside hydrolase family 16 protein [Solirubrobacteraceae bacterium]
MPASMFSRIPRTKLIVCLLFAALMAAVGLGLYGCGAMPAKARADAVRSQRIVTGRREPMPVGNLPGWRQVFSDDFNGRKLDSSKWRLYWGKPGGDPAGWFDPRHVTVSHGMLLISGYRDGRDGGRWATGGLSSSPGLVQTYGKYLVRFRLDPGVGIGHAALLMPANNSWPPEIDFSEDNGSGRTGTLATLHYGKHDTHWDSWFGKVNLTRWHTLGVQWTPGKLQYTLDGRIWETMTGNVVPAVPMVLDLQTQTWPCSGTWGRCPNKSTPRVVRMYVDWVAAYAH